MSKHFRKINLLLIESFYFILLILLLFSFNTAFADTLEIQLTDGGVAHLYDDDGISDWNEARNFDGEIHNEPLGGGTGNTAGTITVRSDDGVGTYRIYRSSNVFDISSLPEGAIVTSATLYLMSASYDEYLESDEIVITSHERIDISKMSKEDWKIGYFGEYVFARGLMVPRGEYSAFGLSESGIEYLNNTEQYAIIGILTHYDFEDVEPNVYTSAQAWFNKDWPDDTVHPYLELEYELGEGNDYPLYTQIESSYPSLEETGDWEDDVYAGGGEYWCGSDIAGCGCVISSLVMAGRNAGVEDDILEGDVNPKRINEYLQSVNGYTSAGSVRWLAASAYLGEWTSDGKIASRFAAAPTRPAFGESAMSFIDEALEGGNKTVLAYKNGHFVWLPEKIEDSYIVRDPWWYETQTADDTDPSDESGEFIRDYDNSFSDARAIEIYDEPVEFSGTDIEAHLTGTAELLFKNSVGEVGYKEGGVLIDLDKASYGNTEVIALDGVPAGADGGKHLLVYEAGEEFTIDVIGTGVGEFTLEFFTIDEFGDVTTFNLSGVTLPGVATTFSFNLATGEVEEQPITYEQFLDIVDNFLISLTKQQKAFFERWTEKMYKDMEEKTVSQALQTIETYGKLLVAKKVDSPELVNLLDMLAGSLVLR